MTGGIFKLFMKLLRELFKVYVFKKKLNCFRSHSCLKILAVFFAHLSVFLFGKKLFVFQRGVALVGYNVACEVENLFKKPWAHIKDKTHS